MSYTKFHTTWASTNLLSAGAFNHIESQYDEIMIDIKLHNHNTLYYTKTQCTSKYFSLTNYSTFDADTLDGFHASNWIGASIPIGGIVIWKGSSSTIPYGYGICDGSTYESKVSPDLRNRFIIGAGGSYAVSAQGGNTELNITGSITIGGHALTIAEIPSHNHSYVDTWNPPNQNNTVGHGYTAYRSGSILNFEDRSALDQDEGTCGQPHGHTGSTIALNVISAIPKYYSLIYIMRYK